MEPDTLAGLTSVGFQNSERFLAARHRLPVPSPTSSKPDTYGTTIPDLVRDLLGKLHFVGRER